MVRNIKKWARVVQVHWRILDTYAASKNALFCEHLKCVQYCNGASDCTSRNLYKICTCVTQPPTFRVFCQNIDATPTLQRARDLFIIVWMMTNATLRIFTDVGSICWGAK